MLQQRLEEMLPDQTSIMESHLISAVQTVDLITVTDRGRIERMVNRLFDGAIS